MTNHDSPNPTLPYPASRSGALHAGWEPIPLGATTRVHALLLNQARPLAFQDAMVLSRDDRTYLLVYTSVGLQAMLTLGQLIALWGHGTPLRCNACAGIPYTPDEDTEGSRRYAGVCIHVIPRGHQALTFRDAIAYEERSPDGNNLIVMSEQGEPLALYPTGDVAGLWRHDGEPCSPSQTKGTAADRPGQYF